MWFEDTPQRTEAVFDESKNTGDENPGIPSDHDDWTVSAVGGYIAFPL